jgi:hypothetical protein
MGIATLNPSYKGMVSSLSGCAHCCCCSIASCSALRIRCGSISQPGGPCCCPKVSGQQQRTTHQIQLKPISRAAFSASISVGA